MKALNLSCALLLAATSLTAASSSASAIEADPLVFGGKVFSTSDMPVEVVAQVWPNQQELLELPAGSAVPIIQVPLVVEGNSYRVHLDSADLPPTHRDEVTGGLHSTRRPAMTR